MLIQDIPQTAVDQNTVGAAQAYFQAIRLSVIQDLKNAGVTGAPIDDEAVAFFRTIDTVIGDDRRNSS